MQMGRCQSPGGLMFSVHALAASALLSVAMASRSSTGDQQRWCIGTPIVTYWAGPPMTDAIAEQMAAGGFNVVWCSEKELDVAHRHGLRAQLYDGLITPASLDDPTKKAQLDALIDRVKNHPALYSYCITDEPSAAAFPALGRIVAYLRERDPAHLAYINLFPTYATNEQLGTKGDVVTAYKEHLRLYLDIVKPDLISYDHYQFAVGGDTDQYFLNLALIREAALNAGLPFLNIVQACTWSPGMRAPKGDEVRYLVYTSLAYGAQGISYYVYCHPGHEGAIARLEDYSPTPLYYVLQKVNREFVAMASELQPLRSLAVYHTGMVPPGTVKLPSDVPFRLSPPVRDMPYTPPKPVKGMVLGIFGLREGKATHVVVVNLDYEAGVTTAVVGPGPLQVFDPGSRKWRDAGGREAKVRLRPGGGRLLRLRPR
ncbi:MAG: hypothetical protein N2512_15400 [Armatimonadetes bacterium]|nr:hypothetical protein [Armatimonadota bacterium]